MTVTTKVSFLLTYADLHVYVGMYNQYVVIRMIQMLQYRSIINN